MKRRQRRARGRGENSLDLYKVVIETHVMATSADDAKERLKHTDDLSDHIEFCGVAERAIDGHAIELGANYLAKLWSWDKYSTQVVTPREDVVRFYLEGLRFKFTDEEWGLVFSWIYPKAEQLYERESQQDQDVQ